MVEEADEIYIDERGKNFQSETMAPGEVGLKRERNSRIVVERAPERWVTRTRMVLDHSIDGASSQRFVRNEAWMDRLEVTPPVPSFNKLRPESPDPRTDPVPKKDASAGPPRDPPQHPWASGSVIRLPDAIEPEQRPDVAPTQEIRSKLPPRFQQLIPSVAGQNRSTATFSSNRS